MRIFCGVATAAMLTAANAQAGTLWIAKINGGQENPSVAVPYTGTGFLVLNSDEKTAVVTATHDIPSDIVAAGHIHRGPVGANGPVVFGFPSVPGTAGGVSPVGPLTWTISTADVANLKAQGLYFNFHTRTNPGGAIRGQIVQALLAPSAANASQLAVANALDVSAGFSTELDRLLMAQALASSAARTQTLEELSGRTVYVQGRQAVETMVDFQETLFGHAIDLAGRDATGLGLFAAAGTSFGERDATVGQAGSKISRPMFVAGVDLTLTDGLTGGLAIGYAKGKDEFNGGVGKTEVETTSVQAFASAGKTIVFSGVAGYGWNKLDSRRALTSLGSTATSSQDGKVWSLAAKVAAPIAIGDKTLAPYAQIDMQRATIDAYSETGAGVAGLVVPERTEETSALEAGATFALPLATASGGMTVRLRAGWRYRLDAGADDFATNLVGSPVAFVTSVQSPSRSAAHVEAAVSGNLAPNLTASAGYRGLLSSDGSTHTLQARFALAF
jgi:outer membrane autotransporter protein